jgi:hypothetical protein
MDESDAERLAAEVRVMDSGVATDDEVAAWLKAQTPDFGGSGHVLSVARAISKLDAYVILNATPTWERAKKRFHLTYPDGSSGGKFLTHGRTFAVGDRLYIPLRPEPPYLSESGRGTAWKVVAVEDDEDPAFTARVTLEPIKRLDDD